MKNFDIDEPYELQRFVPFLKKNEVIDGCEIEIVDVNKPRKQKRLLFHAVFGDKVFKFDLQDSEMERIITEWGDIPRDWIGKVCYIKSVKYYNEWTKKDGLQLKISFLD